MHFQTLGLFCALAAFCAGLLPAQSAHASPNSPPAAAADEVVAVIDGEEFTARRVEHIRGSLPPQFQRSAAQMTHRQLLKIYGEMKALAKKAEQEGIPEMEPYRSQIELNRINLLAGIYATRLNQSLPISKQEQIDYYEAHKSDYEEVKVAAIYIDYSPDPKAAADSDGGEPLSEQEAWVKAEKIAAELRQGADFAEMARKHSDDSASAEKGGELGFFQRDANIPAVLKETIFKLQAGEISAPVKDGGRFYIFKAVERRVPSFEEAASRVQQQLQGVKMQSKLDEIRNSITIEFRNAAYLDELPAADPKTAPPKSAPAGK